MDKILNYYRKSISSKDPNIPYIESSNDLFGFNGSSISIDKYEMIFQKYQLEKGRSQNVIEAFNIWIEDKLPRQILNQKIEVSVDADDIIYFDNVKIYKPYMSGKSTDSSKNEFLPPAEDIIPMYPRDALINGENYSSEIRVDIYSRKKKYESEYDTRLLQSNVIIGKMPIMKGSKYCWLHGMTDTQKIEVGECFTDPLGYFIIDGMEKVIASDETTGAGRMTIWERYKRIIPSIGMYSLTTTNSILITLSVDIKNKNLIEVIFHGRSPFPVFVLSLFLQFLYDKSIVETSNTYQSMLNNCKYILENIIIPEVLEFTPKDQQLSVKYRLRANIINSLSMIEKEIVKYINEMNYSLETDLVDPIAIFSKAVDKFNTSTKASKPLSGVIYDDIIEEIKVNVFPSAEDDSFYMNILSSEKKEFTNGNFDKRRIMLSKMISIYSRFLEGYRDVDDINSYLNKRINTSSRQMETNFNKIFRKSLKDFKPTSLKIKYEDFEKEFKKIFKPDRSKTKDTGSDQLSRDTPAAVYSQLRRVTSTSDANSKNREPRYIHPTQIGFICSGETPEGQNCGTMKHLTTLCWISISRNIDIVEDIIDKYISEDKKSENYITLLVNGDIKGWVDYNLYNEIKKNLKTNIDTYDISVEMNHVDNHINIITTGSIPTRPLFPIDPKTRMLLIDNLTTDQINDMSINDLITEGYIEFNSPGEIDSVYPIPKPDNDNEIWHEINKEMMYIKIAEYVKDVNLLNESHRSGKLLEEQPFTHAEIIPHFQFGISSASVPKANSNKGPRVTYQSSMFKQALSGYHSDHVNRFETSFKLHQFPSRTMFETLTHQPLGFNAMPSTVSPVVAIYVKATNNEDALAVKREYLDSALRLVYYSTNKISITIGDDIVDVRPENENDPKLQALYKRSDNVSSDLVGYPKIGSFVNDGDAILGKYKSIHTDGQKIIKPAHCFVGTSKGGYIVGVEVSRYQNDTIIKIKIAQFRRQIVGDKLASRYSQKGTIGEILSERDLPRIVGGPNDGVVPDFFFNSHSVPSRLTQGMIIEFLMGKNAVYTGKRINASPFGEYLNDNYMKAVEDSLTSRGLSYDGLEKLRFPDGTMIESKIYVGICSYQTLRHHVADKFQFRNIGQYMPDTKQPIPGKSKGGGLRIGEMERDAMISHGAAHVVQDRLMESSDLYKIIVCKNCGNLVPSNFDPRTVSCKCCPGKNDFGVVTLPYIAHHLIRIINASGIHIHYRF